MRINRIGLTNWKGRTAAYTLGQVTVIRGPNASGKTAIRDAIMFALTGSLPIGKLPGTLWQFAGNGDRPGAASVSLNMTGDRRVGIELVRDHKGKTSIVGGCPADIAVPRFLANPLAYFGLTESERMSALYDAAGGDKSKVLSDLVATLNTIEASPLQHRNSAVDNCREIAEATMATAGSAAEGLSNIITRYKDEEKRAKQDADAGTAIVLRHREVAGRKPSVPEPKQACIEELRVSLRGLAVDSSAARTTLANRERCKLAFSAAVDAVTEVEYNLSQLDDITECPHCGSTDKGWVERLRAGLLTNLNQRRQDQAKLEKDLADAAEAARIASEELTAAENRASAQRDELSQKIASAQMEINEWRMYRNALETVNKTEAKIVQHTVAAEVFKLAAKLTEAVRVRAIDETVDALLEVANRITSPILNSPMRIAGGKLGRLVSDKDVAAGCNADIGSWIGHEVWSGTEQLVGYAGLAIALSARAGFRIVILDELGRMDPTKRAMLITLVTELVRDGIIDQFVGIEAGGSSLEVKHYDVH